MSEAREIVGLWKRATAAGDEVCLATIVAIEGSAYRRPGARMLLTTSGQRAGTISGGCLEAEVAKKCWWLTAGGPAIQRYSSFFDDDGEMPWGLGCGGTVVVLLETGEPARQSLEALRRSVEDRRASVLVTDLREQSPGTALILNDAGERVFSREGAEELAAEAHRALRERRASEGTGFCCEFLAPPPSLTVYGAGDDAQPLVEFSSALGWHVTVADGRSNLARSERFPSAAAVLRMAGEVPVPAGGAAVLMTHSYEQDRVILKALLPLPLDYLGVLGPRRRTARLVSELAPELGLDPEECLGHLHAPVGLDLGGHSPVTIALSIAAELQAVFAGRQPRKPALRPVHA